MVAGRRPARVSQGSTTAHLRRRRRKQRLPRAPLEVRTGKWAQEAGLAISMCHLPPGTSKWNKIEHRLFAHISMNWRGRPLVSHEVVVQLIAATTTRQGLRVHAERDLGSYPLKVQVTDDDLATIHLRPHEFHEEWNYDLLPKPIT